MSNDETHDIGIIAGNCPTCNYPQQGLFRDGKLVSLAPCPICTRPAVILQKSTECLICGHAVTGNWKVYGDGPTESQELFTIEPCPHCNAQGGVVQRTECQMCHSQVVYGEKDHDTVFKHHLRRCLSSKREEAPRPKTLFEDEDSHRGY